MVDFNGGGGVVGMDVNGWMAPGYNAGMAASAANQRAVTNPANAFDPFASGGGFGKQTADYSALGAAYGRNVGPQMSDNIYGVSGDLWSRMSASDKVIFNGQMGAAKGGGGGGGIGSDAARAPDQPQPESFPSGGGAANDWYTSQLTNPNTNAFQGGGGGFTGMTPSGQGGIGSDNHYGVDVSTWQSMSPGDRNMFNRQMSDAGAARVGGGSSGSPGANPMEQYNNGGFNPYDPGIYGSSGMNLGAGRNDLAKLMRQGMSPQGPAITPPDNRFYTGNWFGAAGGDGTGIGGSMAPGFGGFDNSAGGSKYNDFFGGSYTPPSPFGDYIAGG